VGYQFALALPKWLYFGSFLAIKFSNLCHKKKKKNRIRLRLSIKTQRYKSCHEGNTTFIIYCNLIMYSTMEKEGVITPLKEFPCNNEQGKGMEGKGALVLINQP
jgi:hypothetical protein